MMNKQIRQICTILAKLSSRPLSFLHNSSQFSDSTWKPLTASIEVVIFMSEQPTKHCSLKWVLEFEQN